MCVLMFFWEDTINVTSYENFTQNFMLSHFKNMQAWIWVLTLQWRKLQHTYVQMMSLYLSKTSRFWKSIVFILLVGNQWTSVYNVMMIHVNISHIFGVLHIPYFRESLSTNSIPIISKWKKITQLFIFILVLLILNTSCIFNVYYCSKIISVWYSEIM